MTIRKQNAFTLVAVVLALTLFAMAANAQDVCPENLVCISQQAANKAAENARELEATKAKVTVLETALAEKDKSIAELTETNRRNTADLRERLHATELELAMTKGQLAGEQAQTATQRAIIEFMLQHGRKKCAPFSILCF